ncbi:hypothetical protein H4S14_002046 [Agrobacterium vitis]|nr:hypothetical protein [Agrobacterium vitis]MBE1438301.1 hypothetical protein [Agrobacterium vitis]
MTTVGTTSSYSTTTGYTPKNSTNDAGTDAAFADLFEEPKNTDASVSTDETEKTTAHIGETEAFTLKGEIVYLQRIYPSGDPSNMWTSIWEMEESAYQDHLTSSLYDIEDRKTGLEVEFTRSSSSDPYAATRRETYATVTVGGKVVAKIDNQGLVESFDQDYLTFKNALENLVTDLNGPAAAQLTAETIAAAVGGTVQKASTAMTQSEYAALPSPKTLLVTDYEAMMSDPRYQELQDEIASLDALQQKRAEYLAQQSAA